MAIQETITIDEVIKMLNQMVGLDAVATAVMLDNKVPCNQALAEHPSIQIGDQNGGHTVSILGILNGLFGKYDWGEYRGGWGAITAVYDHNRNLICFERTIPICRHCGLELIRKHGVHIHRESNNRMCADLANIASPR